MGLPGLIAEVNLNGKLVTLEKIEKTKSLAIKQINNSEATTQKEFKGLILRLTKKFFSIRQKSINCLIFSKINRFFNLFIFLINILKHYSQAMTLKRTPVQVLKILNY